MGNWMESAWTFQSGWVLVNSTWQFLLVALCVATARHLLQLSATQRHRLACVGMLAIAVCPVVTWWSLAYSGDPFRTTWSLSQAWSVWVEGHLATISLCWMVGIAFFSVRPIAGWWGQRRLSRLTTVEIPEDLTVALQRASRRQGIRRAVKLKLVPSQVGPMVAGWLSPTILLPISLLSSLSPQELELLLAHELAHVRRNDCLVNLFQVLVETVFFYHPAVWWLSREIRLSREYCCDDIVAANSADRLDYCRALLKLETQRSFRTALTLAARDGDLLRRVRRLSIEQNEGASASPTISFAMGLLMISIAFAMTIAPPMIEHPASALVASEPNTEPATESPVASPTTADAPTHTTKVAYLDRNLWNVTLDDCLTVAMKNCPVSIDTTSDLEDVSREQQVRNLARDIEVAYWDLYVAHQSAAMQVNGREKAAMTVESAKRMLESGSGTRQELAQAEKQVDRFECQLEDSLAGTDKPGQDRRGLYGHERILRELMGVAISDGQIMCPIDEPFSTPVEYDFNKFVEKTLNRSPELRRTKSRIEHRETEFAVSKHELSKKVDAALLDRWVNPMPETQARKKRRDTDVSASSAYERFKITPPATGSRRELARLHGMHLRITRDSEYLQVLEGILTDTLSDAIAKTATHYQLTQVNGQRCEAAELEVAARSAEYDGGRTTTVNVVLQSLERLVNAEIDYHRSLAEYTKARQFLSYLDGTLFADVSARMSPGQ